MYASPYCPYYIYGGHAVKGFQYSFDMHLIFGLQKQRTFYDKSIHQMLAIV
jgi:hypothetical protein